MKQFKLTLRTNEGVLLERWVVAYDVEDEQDAETLDLAYPIVRGELVTAITNEIRKAQNREADEAMAKR